MTEEEFNHISDSEMLRRIYTSQLRIMMDVEKIKTNVELILEKLDPDIYKKISEDPKSNPMGFRHVSEIHKDFEYAFRALPEQLKEQE